MKLLISFLVIDLKIEESVANEFPCEILISQIS